MINIPPISKSVPVLEMDSKNRTNFLSGVFLRWLNDVANRLNRLNRAVVTDKNGNIAYGGATIPDDIALDATYSFSGLNNECTFASGTKASCLGCYLTSTTNIFRATRTGHISFLVQTASGMYGHYVLYNAVAGQTYDNASFIYTRIV